MNLKTKRMICLLVAIISILTIVGTISYAYFTAVGDTRPQQAALSTATVSVTFSDNDTGISGELSFGESLTKKFTIENTGTADASIKMSWVDMVNTYTEGSLTYTLSYSENEEGLYTEMISKTNVPQSQNPSKKTLASSLTIPVGKTYYYNLVITLNYLEDVNQDADINATFHSKFNVEDIYKKYQVSFDANGGVVDVISKIITENEAYGALPTATHENTEYEFLGWYTEKSGGTKVTESSIVESNEDHTLYAHWKKESVTDKMRNLSQGVKTSFDGAATTDEGIFEMEDDYGTSYYFRGAVKNNYVQFAGFYWRIIRANGDGSLRIIYDGTSAHANGEANTDRLSLTSQVYNANNDDAKYVGWMYGPAGTEESISKEQAQTNTESSDIKKTVDEWYKTNIVDKGYSSAVSDEIFCNDRTASGKESTGWTDDTGLGYGTNGTAYGAYARLRALLNSNSPMPTFKCSQKNDAFTVDDTEVGNGALTYPVGLITADEVVVAGSGKCFTINSSYYLYKGSWYRTLSPYAFDNYGTLFSVGDNGRLNGERVNVEGAVAPVINLSVEYVESMVGTGTMTDPYRAG